MQTTSTTSIQWLASIQFGLVFSLLKIALVLSSCGVECNQASDVGSFWHLTDLHINLSLQTSAGGRWGSYDYDTSLRVIQSAVDKVKSEGQFDFLIYTGDSGLHDHHLSRDQMIESIKVISKAFKSVAQAPHGKSGPIIFPVLGNHDVVPSNAMSPLDSDVGRRAWCTQLAEDPELYGDWIESDGGGQGQKPGACKPPVADFKANCYHSRLYLGKTTILLLGFNGLIWYRSNPLIDTGIEDPLGQFEWIEKSLEWARSNRAKVLIASHFPLGASENAPNRFRHLHPIYNYKLLDLIREYHDVIFANLAAHVHVDSFRVVLDERLKPVGTMFLGPSISPYRLGNLGDFNPRIRHFRFNRTSGQLLTYEQFWLDLSQQSLSWQFEYDAAKEYNLPTLNASHLAELLDNFTLSDSPTLWKAYWSHELGYRPHGHKPTLDKNAECPRYDSVCRCEHICAMRHLDFEELEACLLVCASSTNPVLPSIAQLSEGVSLSRPSSLLACLIVLLSVFQSN